MMKDNEVFSGGSPTWANACVGNNGNPGYWEYAKGFSQAANCLINLVLTELESKHSVDELVYPVCFNMRHSIELRLKGAITELKCIGAYRNIDLEFDYAGTHDIRIIWQSFARNAVTLDDRYQHSIEKLARKIEDIAKVDPTGQTFRYPHDMSKKKHLVEVKVINFFTLSKSFSEIETELDHLHDLNQLLRDEYALGTYTNKLSRQNIFDIASSLPSRSSWRDPSFETIRKKQRDRFKISGSELSRCIKIIESHYEFAPLIGIEIPLRGVSDTRLDNFFRLWLQRHNNSHFETASSIQNYMVTSDELFAAVMKRSETQTDIWEKVKSKLSAEELAGLSALFYFALYLRFSEYYLNQFESDLKEAQLTFRDSEDSIRSAYFHLLDKTNALENILLSLYFLRKSELADNLVTTHDLESRFSWLDEARTGVLFQ